MEAFQTLNKYLVEIIGNHENKLSTQSHVTPGGDDEVTNAKAEENTDWNEQTMAANPAEETMSDPNEQTMNAEVQVEYKIATALFDYPGGYRPDELTFRKDSFLVVVHDSNDGWLYGYMQEDIINKGWFPSNYVVLP